MRPIDRPEWSRAAADGTPPDSDGTPKLEGGVSRAACPGSGRQPLQHHSLIRAVPARPASVVPSRSSVGDDAELRRGAGRHEGVGRLGVPQPLFDQREGLDGRAGREPESSADDRGTVGPVLDAAKPVRLLPLRSSRV